MTWDALDTDASRLFQVHFPLLDTLHAGSH